MLIDRRTFLAAAALALPACAAAQPAQQGPFRFKASGGRETDAEWNGFEVPEDRRDPGSRRIRLNYVRFPSTAARPGTPIVYLAGGPGGPGSGTARGARFPIFMALREVADVIAFDQRGTGASAHIPRRPPFAGPPPPLTREGLTRHFRTEMGRAWADWTAQGVAMAGYNTNESADDLEALRQHLGVERINLWGISYGTTLALAALKRHGGRIDRVALASLEGVHQTVKRPAHLDLYFDRVQRLVASDPEVRTAVPDLPALMRRVHARLEAEPAKVTAKAGGATVELQLGGFTVQMLAGALIKNPDTLVRLPGLYRELDAGRFAALDPILPLVLGGLQIEGMPEAMDLASGVSPAKLKRIEREAKTAVLGDALNFPMPQLIGAIPGVDLGEDFRTQVRFTHPALLIRGTLDGRTPLEEQAEVERQFPNRTQLTVENAGHDVLEAHPGVQERLVRFFRGERAGDQTLSLPTPKFQV